MKNHNNESFDIYIEGYHFEEKTDKYSNDNWLNANLVFKRKYETVNIKWEFLLVEEIERIYNWLTSVLDGHPSTNEVTFIDPNIKFEL